MSEKKIELWVGFLVIIGFLSLLFLAFKVSGVSISFGKKETYLVSAKFSNIGNLRINAPVKVSGVNVGNVKNIILDEENYNALVTLELEKKYHFSRDVLAQIQTMGILGENYIALSQGSDDDFLKEGDMIDITNSAFVLEELINKVMINIFSNHNSKIR